MGTDESGLRRKSALFILKMKEKRFLSQAAIDDMVEETCSVVTSALGMVNASIRGKLADAGVDLTSIDLESVFSNVPEPFSQLKSKHYQEKYFKEELGLIVSEITTKI